MTQTIIVADDHPLFRAALKQAVNQAVPDAETVEVDSIKALQAAVESHPDADLILLDLNMPGAHGFRVWCSCEASTRVCLWWLCPVQKICR